MRKKTPSSSENPFIMDPFALAKNRNMVIRYQITLSFIGERDLGRVLDIGVRNPFTIQLEEKYNTTVKNTEGDLDIIELEGSYDTIFCLEVIEHLMNPLHFLLQVQKILKPGGVLFLSTPKHKPHFLWGNHHFTEYDEFRLEALFARAGFKTVRKHFFRTMPLWWYFTGLRPFLRMFFNKSRIVELVKKTEEVSR